MGKFISGGGGKKRKWKRAYLPAHHHAAGGSARRGGGPALLGGPGAGGNLVSLRQRSELRAQQNTNNLIQLQNNPIRAFGLRGGKTPSPSSFIDGSVLELFFFSLCFFAHPSLVGRFEPEAVGFARH